MELHMLSYQELPFLYEQMQKDFPPQELKPLARLEALYQEGNYHPLVYMKNDAIGAYACLYTGAKPMLLDYYAVSGDLRGQGLGSQVLECILQRVATEGLIAEVEDPLFAQDEETRHQRMRRKQFYERLGFVDTKARVRIFGVPYCVYATSSLNEEEALLAMERIYHGLVPQNIPQREKNIQIR